MFSLLVIVVLGALGVWRWIQARRDRAEEIAIYGRPLDRPDLRYAPPAGMGIVVVLAVHLSTLWTPWLLAETAGVSIVVIVGVAAVAAREKGFWAYWRPQLRQYAIFGLTAAAVLLLFHVDLAQLEAARRPAWDPVDERAFVAWFPKAGYELLLILYWVLGMIGDEHDRRRNRAYRRELYGAERTA